jgi:hypothetical protein
MNQKGKNNPNWKGGFPNCLTCGKQLSVRNGSHCIHHVPKLGSINSKWKGGKPKCLTCGKELWNYSNKYCIKHKPFDHLLTLKFRKSQSKRLIGNQFAAGISGEKHHSWKGNAAGYWPKHRWVSKEFGRPSTCEHCSRTGLTGKQIHWANKDHTYLRQRDNWLRLCVKCHGNYDKIHGLRKHKRTKISY